MSTKGGPVFTFSLPGGRLAPLATRQLRHWSFRYLFEKCVAVSGDSRMKNWGGHCGAKEKSRGANKCLSCMVIFRRNED